ncbi:MAG: helix-turn-helix domain-containing protein [Deltaproteobacteria bacterium]|nr:helix-turn-helix domain-containing protein [Deltaproteobacteria bacterium]
MSGELETIRFSTAEELEHANRETGWDIEYRQLLRAPCSSDYAFREWTESVLMHERHHGSLEASGAPPPAMAALIIPGKPNGRVTFQGEALSGDELLLVAPGGEIDSVILEGLEVLSFCLPWSVFFDAARCVDAVLPEEGSIKALAVRRPPEQVDGLRRHLRGLLERTDSADERTQRARTSNFALDFAQPLFCRGNDPAMNAPYRSTSHRKHLSLAKEYLDANMKGPVKMADVCAHAGIPLRTLERVFQRELSVSPNRYLLARRLSAVRRALVAVDPEHGIVKRVAMDHGFTHMGRFAVNYRRQFAETPSQTLNRVRLPLPVSAC